MDFSSTTKLSDLMFEKDIIPLISNRENILLTSSLKRGQKLIYTDKVANIFIRNAPEN